MHTCIHACIHTCIYIYIYCITPLAWVEIQCFALTAYMLTCLHAYMRTRLHACAYMFARLYALICLNTTVCLHAYVLTCLFATPCSPTLTHIDNHLTPFDTYLITISGRTFPGFCILVFDSPTGFRFGLFPNISGSSDGSLGPRGPQPGSQITEF